MKKKIAIDKLEKSVEWIKMNKSRIKMKEKIQKVTAVRVETRIVCVCAGQKVTKKETKG